jgi:hypothetical protein
VDEEKIDENQENQTISPILLSRYLISRKVTVVEDLGGQLALSTLACCFLSSSLSLSLSLAVFCTMEISRVVEGPSAVSSTSAHHVQWFGVVF